MAMRNTNLYMQHRFSKPVPATKEEAALAKPFQHQNKALRNRIGCLLIHGFTSTPDSMRDIAVAVTKECYLSKAVLLPGHGTSPEDLADTTANDWIQYIEKQYLALMKECDQIVLIGQSLGGAIAAELASHHPQKINALFLLSPAFYTPFSVKLGYFLEPILRLIN